MSPPTPTPLESTGNTEKITTPTRPLRTDITASPTIRFRPPIPVITASPIIRIRPPIPDFSASPPIRFRPPIPDISASETVRVRPPLPDITASTTIPSRPPISDVTARPVNQATLNVSPAPVEVGKPVLFEVILWQPPPPGWNLQYRFDFGDGTQTDWTSERQATHTYLSPRTGGYPVHVEIASTYRDRAMPGKAIDKNVDVIPPLNPTPSTTPSPPITPSPTPAEASPTSTSTPTATAVPTIIPFVNPATPPSLPPSKMLWIYVVVGLAVAGLAYFLYAKWKPKALIAGPVAFYPHSDWDAPRTAPKNLAINYGLYFHPNVSTGQGRLETDNASSILRKKKQ